MTGGREDEEVARKRRYWEKFAKEQIKQLFGEPEEIIPQREPLYTAQIGIKVKQELMFSPPEAKASGTLKTRVHYKEVPKPWDTGKKCSLWGV